MADDNGYKDWYCPGCGHEVLAKDKPESIWWNDGHRCWFIEDKEEKNSIVFKKDLKKSLSS